MRFSARLSSMAAAAVLGFSAWGSAMASQVAEFDPATLTLTMPELRLGSAKANDVVVRFLDFGVVQVNDPSVGQHIEYLPSNVIKLPSLMFGGVQYPAVSLTGSAFHLVSFGTVEVDSGTGSYTLVVTLTVAGSSSEVSRIQNAAKPASQAEFCDDARMQDLRNTITQHAGGGVGEVTLKSCSFDGATGQIAMDMMVQSPVPGFTLSVPYKATFSYQ